MPRRRTDAGVLVKTTIEVPEDLWKEAKILAIEEGVTLGRLIELALREFIKAKKGEGEGLKEIESNTSGGSYNELKARTLENL
jgi:hypothetical protein